MGRRTVLLVAAVLVAALGAGLVLIYVHDVNQKVKAREAPEQILVAKKIIPAGTTGAAASAEGDLQVHARSRSEAVAAGALATIDPVANLVALAPIYPGEQILSRNSASRAHRALLTIPTAGTMALSISLSGPGRGQRLHRAWFAGRRVPHLRAAPRS